MTTATKNVTAADVRAWGRAKGLFYGTRGVLPKSLIAAYNKNHTAKFKTA